VNEPEMKFLEIVDLCEAIRVSELLHCNYYETETVDL
jgi:hypothetical protein